MVGTCEPVWGCMGFLEPLLDQPSATPLKNDQQGSVKGSFNRVLACVLLSFCGTNSKKGRFSRMPCWLAADGFLQPRVKHEQLTQRSICHDPARQT